MLLGRHVCSHAAMYSTRLRTVNILSLSLASMAVVACDDHTDTSSIADGSGPPLTEDSKVLRDVKADGAISLGSPTVRGRYAAMRLDLGAESQCHTGDTVEFDVAYENHSLPWGSRVTLVRAFSGESHCFGCDPVKTTHYDWIYEEYEAMDATAPWTWRAQTTEFRNLVVEDNLQYFKFVVRIELPDGSVVWDNGGSHWGHYRTQIPWPVCNNLADGEENDGTYVDLGVWPVHQS